MDELAHSHHHHHPSPGSTCDAGHSPAATVKDPVCGMSVNPAKTPHRTDLDGVAHVFCSAGCKGKFVADPKRYLEPAPRAQAPADAGRALHVSDACRGPADGSRAPARSAAWHSSPCWSRPRPAPNPELIDMTRRLWIGGALAIPVVGLAMAGDVADLSGLVSPWASNWIQLGLAVPIVVWAGWPFWVRGWQSLVTRHLNMFTLIAIGTGVAMAYSVVATVAPGLFPEGVRQADGTVGVYFDSSRGRDRRPGPRRTGAGVTGTRDDRRRNPRSARSRAQVAARRVSADGSEQDIPIEALVPGDRFRVRPGEQVATDGLVVDGRGLLDQAMVTGEAMPVSRSAGDNRHRRHREPDRQLRGRGSQGRARHAAGADRSTGLRGAAQPGTDPAAGRSRRRPLRAGRPGCGRPDVRCLDGAGPAAAPGPRHDCRRVGADHRLSVCARAGDPDVDHGRGRARRPGGRAGPRRRSARAFGAGRHAGVSTRPAP